HKAYYCRAVRNAAIDICRVRKRPVTISIEEWIAFIPAPEPDPDPPTRSRYDGLVREAIGLLSDAHREIMEVLLANDLDASKTLDAMGESRATQKVRLHAARSR